MRPARLALAFGWPVKTVLIIFALSLAGGWVWRLGVADSVIWAVESWTKTDLDGDGHQGAPATPIRGGESWEARQTASKAAQTAAEERRRAELLKFLDKCYLAGTSEGAHGITASGPDRARYTACRDTLMGLGLARWKNPNRPKGGWVMTTDPATAKGVAEKHVIN